MLRRPDLLASARHSGRRNLPDGWAAPESGVGRLSCRKMLVVKLLSSAMTRQQQERRKRTRFRIAIPVVLQTPSGELKAELRDVSPGGAFVRSATLIAVGTKVKMSFTVPGQGTFLPELPVRCDATVVRAQRFPDGGFGIALESKRIEEGT
jgi:hypothetical protein